MRFSRGRVLSEAGVAAGLNRGGRCGCGARAGRAGQAGAVDRGTVPGAVARPGHPERCPPVPRASTAAETGAMGLDGELSGLGRLRWA